MAVKVWIARQQARAQVDQMVLASGVSGASYSVTINGKTITFTTSGTTAAPAITSGLLSGLINSTEPEFSEITWTGISSGLQATAGTAGKPFTYSITLAGSSGGFFNTSGVVANLSPSDVNDGVNYETSGKPATGDDLIFDGRVKTPAKWNLDLLSGISLNTLEVSSVYGGTDAQIGLSELDEDGDYPQYRPIYLGIGATVVNIGRGTGVGIRLLKLDTGNSGLEYNILKTGTPLEDNREAVTIKGINSSGRANVSLGSFGFAVLGGESGRLVSLNIGVGTGTPRVNLGFGADMASGTINFNNGSLTLNGRVSTLNYNAGTGGTITGSGAILALNVRGGSLTHQGTGPIGSITVGTPGQLTLSDVGPALTISGAVTLAAQTSLTDRGFRGSYASGIVYSNCRMKDVTVDLGPSRTIKPS